MTGILSSTENNIEKIEEIIQDQTLVENIEKEKYPDISNLSTLNREEISKEIKLDDRKDYFDFSNTAKVNSILEMIRINPIIINNLNMKSEEFLSESNIESNVESNIDSNENNSHKMEEID